MRNIQTDWHRTTCIDCGKWYETDLNQGQSKGFDGRMITLSDGNICHVCDLGSWIHSIYPIIPFRIANAIAWLRMNYWLIYKSGSERWSPRFNIYGKLINK